jgi:hypothetical protein
LCELYVTLIGTPLKPLPSATSTSDLSNVCCPQQAYVPRDEFDSGYRVMSAIVGRMVAQWLVWPFKTVTSESWEANSFVGCLFRGVDVLALTFVLANFCSRSRAALKILVDLVSPWLTSAIVRTLKYKGVVLVFLTLTQQYTYISNHESSLKPLI